MRVLFQVRSVFQPANASEFEPIGSAHGDDSQPRKSTDNKKRGKAKPLTVGTFRETYTQTDVHHR